VPLEILVFVKFNCLLTLLTFFFARARDIEDEEEQKEEGQEEGEEVEGDNNNHEKQEGGQATKADKSAAPENVGFYGDTGSAAPKNVGYYGYYPYGSLPPYYGPFPYYGVKA
jgi:hypothetical protein